MTELWKPLKDWEGLYEVSTLGSFRSLRRKKLLSLELRKDGYLMAFLSKNRTTCGYYAHRLIAKTFLENPSNLSEVNHKNAIRNDNRLQNLEWVNRQQNVDHCTLLRGGRPSGARLSAFEVQEILKLSVKGVSALEISKKFNVHAASVRRIKRGATWKHLIK